MWCYFRLYKVFHDIDTHIRDALFGGETQGGRKIALKTSPLKKRTVLTQIMFCFSKEFSTGIPKKLSFILFHFV